MTRDPVSNTKSAIPTPKARLARGLRRYRNSQDGNVALMLTLTLGVILASIGAVMDFRLASTQQTDMQARLDSVVLMAAAEYDLEQQRGSQKARQRKERKRVRQLARKFYNSSCKQVECPSVDRLRFRFDDNAIHATFTGTYDTKVMSMFGTTSLDVSARSSAALQSAQSLFVDVNFLVDASGSMNIADGVGEIAKMNANFDPFNSGKGCAFACHVPNFDANGNPLLGGVTGAMVADNLGIYTREQRVRDAVERMSLRMLVEENAGVRINMHVFAGDVWDRAQSVTTKAAARAGAQGLDNNSGHTHVDDVVRKFGAELPQAGTGRSDADRTHLTILVTDGMHTAFDSTMTRFSVPMDPAACDAIKAKGGELYVLNVVYPDPDLLDDPTQPDVMVIKAARPHLEPALRACASPDGYFEAHYGSDVIDAFDRMHASYKSVFTQKLRLLD